MTGNTENVNRMMTFALRWFPHGGGPAEEIVAVLGMDTGEFFRLSERAAALEPPTPLRPEIVEKMKAVARRSFVARGLRPTARGRLGRAPVAYRQLALWTRRLRLYHLHRKLRPAGRAAQV